MPDHDQRRIVESVEAALGMVMRKPTKNAIYRFLDRLRINDLRTWQVLAYVYTVKPPYKRIVDTGLVAGITGAEWIVDKAGELFLSRFPGGATIHDAANEIAESALTDIPGNIEEYFTQAVQRHPLPEDFQPPSEEDAKAAAAKINQRIKEVMPRIFRNLMGMFGKDPIWVPPGVRVMKNAEILGLGKNLEDFFFSELLDDEERDIAISYLVVLDEMGELLSFFTRKTPDERRAWMLKVAPFLAKRRFISPELRKQVREEWKKFDQVSTLWMHERSRELRRSTRRVIVANARTKRRQDIKSPPPSKSGPSKLSPYWAAVPQWARFITITALFVVIMLAGRNLNLSMTSFLTRP